MTTKQRSIDFKSVCIVIVALSVFSLVITVQPGGAYASSNNDNDDDDDNDNDNDNDNNGSDNDGDSGSGLIDRACEFIRENPLLTELGASALGLPGGAGMTVGALCSLGN